MKPLALEDLLDLESYERVRPAYRDAIIALKGRRRIAVGDRVSVVFESRETLRFQVQEMLRVERIREPERVQDELDVYNELLPGSGELSATLFIEITELSRVRPELDRLVGIDEQVSLVVGDGPGIPARFDPKQMEEDRISAVHYLRFALDGRSVEDFAHAEVRLRIDHPSYVAEAVLGDATRRELLADLRGETTDLLDRRAGAPPRSEVLHETSEVRVLRPSAREPDHLVVELRRPGSLLELAPDALAAGLVEVQRLARELRARHGGCRVSVDAEASPVRWHLRGHA